MSTTTFKNVWVIIPAYNVEPFIGSVLDGIILKLSPEQIVVVDDGSTDQTRKIVQRKGVRLVTHQTNQGKGEAILSGIRFVKEQIDRRGKENQSNLNAVFQSYENLKDTVVITIDADGQHPPEVLEQFINLIFHKGYDLVVGRRKILGTSMPWDRRFSNWATSCLLSLVLKKRIWDSQCGYRAFRLASLDGLSFHSQRYDFETEFLIKVVSKGAKVGWVEIPTLYQQSNSSINRFQDTCRFISTFFRTLWEMRVSSSRVVNGGR